jgi:hypothetical protein
LNPGGLAVRVRTALGWEAEGGFAYVDMPVELEHPKQLPSRSPVAGRERSPRSRDAHPCFVGGPPQSEPDQDHERSHNRKSDVVQPEPAE